MVIEYSAGREGTVKIIAIFAIAITIPQVRAADDAFAVTQGKAYKFEKVADGVYYASGGLGSNNVVIVNDQDVVLVDDGTTPAAARALLQDIKLITTRPVKTVINTHFHYDHTDGNSIFPPDVEIIGHEYVRTAILTFNVLDREPYTTSSKNLATTDDIRRQLTEIKPTPPNTTYASKMTLHRGGREIQLLFLGRGHTGGDTFVYLPKERIVCTGDEDEGARLAYMGDGLFDEWIATLEALKKLDFTLVLPGHGRPFHEKALITAFQSYLRDVVAKVTDLRRQGATPDQAAVSVDLTSHSKDFPDIKGPGADLRGVRRIYEWLDENHK